MKKRPKLWKGSRVKIIEPRFFIRCGYNFYPDMFLEDSAQKVSEFLISKGIDPSKYPKQALTMSREFAYIITSKRNFGGSARKIFEIDGDPDLKMQIAHVLDFRRVVTGTRYQGFTSYNPYEEDSEGPSLDNQKHHIVLTLDGIRATYREEHTGLTKQTYEMLAEHVVQIPKNYENIESAF